MIDKSIRQYYANGKKVNPFLEGVKTIAGKAGEELLTANIGKPASKFVTTREIPKVTEVLKGLAKARIENKLTQAALTKAGSGIMKTGALSFLGPLAPFAAMYLAYRAVGKVKDYARDTFSKESALSADTKSMLDDVSPTGITGIFRGINPITGRPNTQAEYEAARELSNLQNRRDYMLDRLSKNKKISKKNLDDVTKKIDELTKVPDTPFDESDKGYDKGSWGGYGSVTAYDKATEEAHKRAVDMHRGDETKSEPTTTTATTVSPSDGGFGNRSGRRGEGGGGTGSPGGGAQAAGDAAGGVGLSSPFARGGRIDKALGGRVRDI